MKDCGINNIDIERRLIEKNISSIISECRCCNSPDFSSKASKAKADLLNFRMKLACNRATEALESKFGWSSEFSKFNQELDKIINPMP